MGFFVAGLQGRPLKKSWNWWSAFIHLKKSGPHFQFTSHTNLRSEKWHLCNNYSEGRNCGTIHLLVQVYMWRVGCHGEDHTKVFWLLNGLGPEYEAFTVIVLRPPTSKYVEVVALLQNDEEYAIYVSTNHSAFAVQHRQDNRPWFQRPQQHQTNFNSRGRGFSRAAQPNSSSRGSNGNNLNRYSERFMLLLILRNISKYYGYDKLMAGNGEKLKIFHVGSAHLGKRKWINTWQRSGCYQDKKNAISVSQLTVQFPYIFEFSADGFVVKEKLTRL